MARGRPATPLGTHGDIGITQLGEKKFRAETRLRLYNGKLLKVRAIGASKTAARRNVEQRCKERLQGADTQELTTTSPMSKLLDIWLPRHDVSERSRTIYENSINTHIKPALGEIRLNEISTPDVQQFLDVLTPGSAQTARAALGAACGLAVRWGVMATNPVRDTQLKKREKQEVNALTKEQMDAYRERLIEWSGGNGMGPKRGEALLEIMDVIRGSGARIGEVLALRWQDVDLEKGTISITGTTDEKGGRKSFPKTDTSRRVIPVAGIAVRALERQSQKAYRELFGEVVFPSRNGTYRTVNNTETRLRDARGDMKIKPHDFRKTVATRIEEKFGLLAASRHLGHASTAVTEQAYLAAPDVVPDYTKAFES